MRRHLKVKYTIAFEIVAKEDLALIESKTRLNPALGSFRMGAKITSLFKPRPGKTHYRCSRLSITSTAPANAGLERHAASIISQLDIKRLRRVRAQLTACRFQIRIGVFYVTELPQIELPTNVMELAVNTNAELSLDCYKCSSMAPVGPKERLVRARLLRHLKQELTAG